VTATGAPGDFVLFMIDKQLGTSTLPIAGGFEIGLAQSSSFRTVFKQFRTATESVTCVVTCDQVAVHGLPFYVQAASFNPVTSEICVSNIEELRWEDSGTTCEPCAPCAGKITELTMQYNGTVATTVRIEGRGPAAGVLYEMLVLPGEQFTFIGNDSKGTMGTKITFYENGAQTATMHTSCSEVIGPGTTAGPFEVISGRSRNGGPLCPLVN
jgi:hypothetical protein